MAFTFGSTAPTATSAAPLFGSTAPAAASTAPLFGAATTTAAPAASTSLFGATSTAQTSAPLFGATTSSAPSAGGGLFGTTTSTAATTTAASGGGLFGATPAKTSVAPGGLFGSTAPTTTSAATTGGLFGSTSTTASTTGGGLFGATTSAAPSGGGLFGSTTATTTAPAAPATLGLGGSASAVNPLASGGTGTTLGAPTAEKENVREGEVPKPIMELLQQVKNKIKENKSSSDQFVAASTDNHVRIKDRLVVVNHMISKGVSAAADGDAVTARLAARVQRDLRLGKEAHAVQEAITRNPHTAVNQHTVQHMIELIQEYDATVIHFQEIIEQLTIRMRDILQGKAQMTTDELREYLTRFDVIFSAVANKLFEANSKVQELKSALASEGQIQLREAVAEQPQSWWQMRGPAAFPSQSTLIQIGAMLKPAAVAGAPGTLGATTGTGLFGSTGTTGGSLFGSSTAAKPSLFGSTTTGTTGGSSLFPSLTTTSTAQPTSLFPSLTSTKPATSFGSTLSTNASGLLFSSKK